MTPRKSSSATDADALYETAVRALARRARSTAEVRSLLEKKQAGPKLIEAIVNRLRENGYLDDARFGRYFASARLENDLHGKARVRRDLNTRGLKEDIAERAITSAYQGIDEGKLLREYIRRKVNVSRIFSKQSAVASLHRRLLRAGFASDTIVHELKRILQSSPGAGRVAGPVSWDELLDSLSEISETEAEFDE